MCVFIVASELIDEKLTEWNWAFVWSTSANQYLRLGWKLQSAFTPCICRVVNLMLGILLSKHTWIENHLFTNHHSCWKRFINHFIDWFHFISSFVCIHSWTPHSFGYQTIHHSNHFFALFYVHIYHEKKLLVSIKAHKTPACEGLMGEHIPSKVVVVLHVHVKWKFANSAVWRMISPVNLHFLQKKIINVSKSKNFSLENVFICETRLVCQNV